ncbi:MAG: OmpA family protein [Alphaproteobacteria bacterium]|nr:OmpA family protein [Alphaproteobacteria bacterium]
MKIARQYHFSFATSLGALPRLNKADTSPAWMTTFLDILALLLTFFVMVLAMSSPRPGEFEEVAGAIASEFQSEERGPGISLPTDLSARPDTAPQALALGYVSQLLLKTMADDPVLKGGRITALSDRLIVSLPSDGVFKVGSAELSAEGKKAMAVLAERLALVRNRISLVGHTDQDRYTGDRYKSNWGLGLARAATVASVFRRGGYDQEIRVLTQADSRFADLAADLEPPVKRRLARRVDLVIHPTQSRSFNGGAG